MARAMAAGMTAAISACGGGGGDGGGLPFQGIGGGGDPDGGQGDGTIMPIEERSAATRRVHDKYMELVASGTAAPFEALVDWALTQPEYDQAGKGKDTFWARFKDGRYFVYTDNWRKVDPLELPRLPQSASAARTVGLAAVADAGKPELPETELAVIMCGDGGDGSGEFDAVKPFQQKVTDALKERGWTIHPDHAVTVDSFLGLSGKQIGLMYLACHSAELGPTGQRQFGIFSETRATAENEKKYEALFKAGLLVYHRDRDREAEARGGNPPVYGLTDGFLKEHLLFGKGSLVVTLACNSGSPEGSPIREALSGKGAGTIVAWDGSTNPFGALSMVYMFDRLTGTNAFDPGKPANRAFALDDVWTFMREKTNGGIKPNLLITPHVNKEGKVDPLAEPAYIKRFGDGFDLSNPVISELSVDSGDRLLIHGNFGTEAGEVSIGGTTVAVEGWGNDKITLVLPTAASDPPGSHGDVIVTARKRTSNRRVLTSWRGVVEYTYSTLWLPGNTGLLTCDLSINLHLRGDAHALRTAVDGSLKRSVQSFIPASDSKVTYKASGTNVGGLSTRTWSGSGSLPYTGLGFEGNSVSINAAIDVVGRLIKIAPAVVGEDLLLVKTTSVSGSTDTKTFLPFHTNALGYTDAFGGDKVAYGTAFELDAAGNVPAYDKRLPVPPYELDMASMRVKTGGMTADPPFDDTVGR